MAYNLAQVGIRIRHLLDVFGAQCIELDGLDGWEDVRRHGACVVEDYRMTSGSGWLL